MKLILTVTEQGVFLDRERIPDDQVAELAILSKVIDKSQPQKIVLDLQADLSTPGVWRLPFVVLKRLY